MKYDNAQLVVKHLEIIQGVVNRLAHDSFLIKGWSITILAAAMLFISRHENISLCIFLCFIVTTIGFWVLDSYFLWHERCFRGLYDDVRNQSTTNFCMNTKAQISKPDNRWRDSMRSCTLNIFYLIEMVFIGAVLITLISTRG